MTATALPDAPRSDIEVISLIGFVHGVSHFFQLLLPTLFPWLMQDFNLSFTAIGMTTTVFFVISGLGQAVSGFLVDRFGAVRVLGGGIACFALAGLVLHFASGYPMLIAVAIIAGLGNSIFHPADFTILNHRVSQPRLGHAFAVHGLSGNLGWAAAPIFMTGIATTAGWQTAALAASLVAIAAMILLFWRRETINEAHDHRAAASNDAPSPTFAFLGSRAVWLCFLFFLFITAAFGAIQNFASPILQAVYALSLTTAALALSTYMVGAAAGIVLGGFLAQKNVHEHLIAGALGVAALLAILLASSMLPAWAILPLMGGIGFCTGIAGPSRDLLVRKAATARFGKSAYGRVYGFVYSGLDLGLALAPVIFGSLMDGRRISEVLVGIAILQTLAIFSALRVGKAV
ncbi:MFS transporter [Dechloromonas sp. HYN0024]|uniref:MFS transporter n=1 Tax=Dechloromonas sp. HYN0024 TaxID=2231055 RepID=UPI000E44736D|nr:MFS transporter [Dechloromonas sp. HYN0024]AXS79892.1 MFS transporter [Dechloromonas sp. HYN0024]